MTAADLPSGRTQYQDRFVNTGDKPPASKSIWPNRPGRNTNVSPSTRAQCSAEFNIPPSSFSAIMQFRSNVTAASAEVTVSRENNRVVNMAGILAREYARPG
ncbi:hypothetical protein G6F65_021185 [Rhizopus arrhizus]|nr:hypothetical protein G6F65_021185 [Rhizopus arrhizus]